MGVESEVAIFEQRKESSQQQPESSDYCFHQPEGKPYASQMQSSKSYLIPADDQRSENNSQTRMEDKKSHILTEKTQSMQPNQTSLKIIENCSQISSVAD